MINKRRMAIAKAMAMLILSVLLLAMISCRAEDGIFIRIDRDDPNAWREALVNVRFLEDEGMSGSAQFSEAQFHDLAARLRERSDEVWMALGRATVLVGEDIYFITVADQ